MLIETIRKELMNAMREKDKPKKEVLTMIVAGIKNKEIEKRHELNSEEEIEVISREIKQIKETIELTQKDRTELIDANNYKIQVLLGYLPKQMTEVQIREEIESILKSLGLGDKMKGSDRGKVMKELIPKTKGKADGKLVSELVGSYIG